MVEEILRSSRRSKGSLRFGWRCPGESALAAFADGRLADSRRLEVHLSDCEACREQVAFLLRATGDDAEVEVPAELLVQAKAMGKRAGVPVVSAGWRWATAVAVTACLVLLVSRQVKQQEPGVVFAPPSPPGVASGSPGKEAPSAKADSREGEEVPSVRGKKPDSPAFRLLHPLEGAKVSGKVDFRWQPVPGSLFYEVRVTTAAGDPVWQSERFTTTGATAPPSVQFTPHEKHFVWVVAFLPEGKTVQSKAIAFTVGN